jgi:hypothetical protein
MRFVVVALVSVAVLAPAGALAKEGVAAHLENPSVLGAPTGKRISLVWTLRADKQSFGAQGVYVRLRGRDGAMSTGDAVEVRPGSGRYRALVDIPRGGVRAIFIRLKGWTSGPRGTVRADMSFPITNDPTR